jgi:hypothetical protein
MVTLLTEQIMNNQPSCKVSNDPKDTKTITPAMLLTPRANWVTLPPGLPEGASYHQANWRLVQHLTDVFWTRWQKESANFTEEVQMAHPSNQHCSERCGLTQ